LITSYPTQLPDSSAAAV